MVKPEIIGLLAVAILFLLTVPFFSSQPLMINSGGSGSDSNQVKVSANDTVADYLFSKLQAGSGITLSIQNPGGDENILITATGAGGSGSGRTYTSGTPATIEVNNDSNTISQNFDGNFTSRINALDLNNSLTYSKVNCDNNVNCTITGKITTTRNIDANNIKFTGVLSGGDFNYSLSDANGSQSCSSPMVLRSVGQTVTCANIAVPSGSGDILGTSNQIQVNNGTDQLFQGDATLSLPQDINRSSSPTFANMNLTFDLNAMDANIAVDLNVHRNINLDQNLNIDGNILFVDANSEIGSNTIPVGSVNTLNVDCRASIGAGCLIMQANRLAFEVGEGTGTGIFFASAPQSIQFRVTNSPVLIGYLAVANLGMNWLGEPRQTAPTIAASGIRTSSIYVQTFSDINRFMYYDNNTWKEIGSDLSNITIRNDIQIGGNGSFDGGLQIGSGLDTNYINAGGGSFVGVTDFNRITVSFDSNFFEDVSIDGNLFGQNMSLFSAIGTSCNTLCGSVVVDGPWACVEARLPTGTASTCSQTAAAANCICKN